MGRNCHRHKNIKNRRRGETRILSSRETSTSTLDLGGAAANILIQPGAGQPKLNMAFPEFTARQIIQAPLDILDIGTSSQTQTL